MNKISQYIYSKKIYENLCPTCKWKGCKRRLKDYIESRNFILKDMYFREEFFVGIRVRGGGGKYE